MKVTIFIGGISGGGAERVACNLANYLSERGNVIKLLVMSETPNVYGLKTEIERHALLLEKERTNKIFDNLKRFFRLKKYIQSNACDQYVVFLPITICLLLHFSKMIKGSIIASERNDPQQYSKIQKLLLRHYAPKADKWVFQTEVASKWYGSRIKDFVVIPNAINPDFSESHIIPEQREKLIIAVGRLNKQKNYPMLIDAFDMVAKKHCDYRLEIYGKGQLESELKLYAKEKDCCNNIIFCGYKDNMPEQLMRAQIFVMSSNFEGMPNALMEAMAMGLPCISTDCPCGGPRFLINDHKNGILVEVNDSIGLSIAINEVIEDEALRETLGVEAQKIKEKLSPEIIYQKWEQAISESD